MSDDAAPRSGWQRFRRIWATTGISLTVVFVVWSLIAYRANGDARAATVSDAVVTNTRADGVWRFTPVAQGTPAAVGLVFFPGALVDPTAYAPLARAVAEAGYPVIVMELPKRGAFGGADDPALFARSVAAVRADDTRWVVAGHSRGAGVAATFASRYAREIAGLVLLGTTHPRDVDLSGLTIPVTKVLGTKDGVAPESRSNENRHLLPAATTWVRIEGGNHSQFGWYGFQPGDHRAGIDAHEQHRQVLAALLAVMRAAD